MLHSFTTQSDARNCFSTCMEPCPFSAKLVGGLFLSVMPHVQREDDEYIHGQENVANLAEGKPVETLQVHPKNFLRIAVELKLKQ